MLTHYLKIALRNMRRFKLQTIVCLTGLAVGMTCFALGTLWLRFIASFEDFVPEGENVCLVTTGKSVFGTGYDYFTFFDDGQRLKDNLPEVEDFCTAIHLYDDTDVWEVRKADGDETTKMYVCRTDTSYFRFMRMKAVEGTLAHLNSGEAVVTRSTARRLFGGESALGQQVLMKEAEEFTGDEDPLEAERHSYTVVAVVEDCPLNTQFYYDAIVPFLDDDYRWDGSRMYHTFVRLNPVAPRDSIVCRNLTVKCMMHYGLNGQNVEGEREFLLAPLMQLRTDYCNQTVLIGTQYVQWFRNIGVLVILCSLFNYLITMSGHIRRRGWEMSLRRVLGSSRRGILVMFGIETGILFVLSSLLGFVLTLVVLPYFREYSGINLPLSDISWRLAGALAFVIVCGIGVSALTAWLVMQRIAPLPAPPRGRAYSVLTRSAVITPTRGSREGGLGLVLQMTLSMGIIFCTVVMLLQIDYLMHSDDLGFRHNDMGLASSVSEEVKQKIRQSPLVEKVLDNGHHFFPRYMKTSMGISDIEEIEEMRRQSIEYNPLDSQMADFFGVQLLRGSLPVYQGESDNGSWLTAQDICINEAMCRYFHISPDSAIGHKFYSFSNTMTVCGVVRDMYIAGPTVQPEPCFYMPTLHEINDGSLKFITKPGRVSEMCDSVQAWIEQDTDRSPWARCQNAEAEFEKYVASEMMLVKILFAVGGASLFVCVIGTFSLVSLALQRRRKEIAIRKVHGAKMRDILRLFLRGQVASLCIAAIIAYPIAYIIMRHWLENYQKQVGIDWWLIPATFAAIAAVVLATITLKIWRAAKESTVEALAV